MGDKGWRRGEGGEGGAVGMGEGGGREGKDGGGEREGGGGGGCGGRWWCGPWDHKRVSGDTLACVQRIKWASASALAPSAGLSSRKKTYACSLRRQVPGVPKHKSSPNRKSSPPHPPLLRRKGGRNLFHLLGVGCPGSGMISEVAPGRVFLASRTLLPLLPPASKR